MPQRSVPLIADEYYHVYNRGNNARLSFWSVRITSFSFVEYAGIFLESTRHPKSPILRMSAQRQWLIV
jgi:hypothetical protein